MRVNRAGYGSLRFAPWPGNSGSRLVQLSIWPIDERSSRTKNGRTFERRLLLTPPQSLPLSRACGRARAGAMRLVSGLAGSSFCRNLPAAPLPAISGIHPLRRLLLVLFLAVFRGRRLAMPQPLETPHALQPVIMSPQAVIRRHVSTPVEPRVADQAHDGLPWSRRAQVRGNRPQANPPVKGQVRA